VPWLATEVVLEEVVVLAVAVDVVAVTGAVLVSVVDGVVVLVFVVVTSLASLTSLSLLKSVCMYDAVLVVVVLVMLVLFAVAILSRSCVVAVVVAVFVLVPLPFDQRVVLANMLLVETMLVLIAGSAFGEPSLMSAVRTVGAMLLLAVGRCDALLVGVVQAAPKPVELLIRWPSTSNRRWLCGHMPAPAPRGPPWSPPQVPSTQQLGSQWLPLSNVAPGAEGTQAKPP